MTDLAEDEERRNEAREEQEAGRELRDRIDLGFEARQFLESRLGQVLRDSAEASKADLMEEMVTLDPDIDAHLKRMRSIRFEIAVLNAWKQAIDNVIADGEMAQKEFIESERIIE